MRDMDHGTSTAAAAEAAQTGSSLPVVVVTSNNKNSSNSNKSAHAIYCKVLQPAYERMVIKHLYLNDVSLKSDGAGGGGGGQLLKKRQKTSGHSSAKFANIVSGGGGGGGGAAVWNPTFTEHWQILNSSFDLSPTTTAVLPPFKPQQQQADEPPPPPTVAAAAGDHQKQRRVTYPVLTDERNIRTSTHVNQFNVTTRMREIPLVNIFHKKSTTTLHLHHHRTRSPSSRGVRASAITGRSLFSALSNPNLAANMMDGGSKPERRKTAQNIRMMIQGERKCETRQRRKLAQVSGHRVDRMYYMQGSASKLHARHTIDDEIAFAEEAGAGSPAGSILDEEAVADAEAGLVDASGGLGEGEKEADDDLSVVEEAVVVVEAPEVDKDGVGDEVAVEAAATGGVEPGDDDEAVADGFAAGEEVDEVPRASDEQQQQEVSGGDAGGGELAVEAAVKKDEQTSAASEAHAAAADSS